MIDHWTRNGCGQQRRRRAIVPGVVLACALVAGGTVAAQPPAAQQFPLQAQPAPQQDAPAVAPQVAPDLAFQPGFLDALGRWLGDSKAKIDEQLKTTQDVIGGLGTQATGAARDAAGAAQQATGAIVGLPGARIVDGRERCPLAGNGAPDCVPAANALCRKKGFGSGRGLDINSSQKCPAWVWWSGRTPAEGECTPETFVQRAMCQ